MNNNSPLNLYLFEIDGHQRHVRDNNGLSPVDGQGLYEAEEVDAALAAKDARIRELELSQSHLMDRLDQINIWANEERNNHGDSRKLAQIVDWSGGYAKLPPDPNAQPHPDTARLDKLPACFHMLRFAAVTGKWWLTYAPDNEYTNPREAIDAHVEPREAQP